MGLTGHACAKAGGANCVFLAGDYLNNGAQLVKDKVAVLGPNSGAVRMIASLE